MTTASDLEIDNLPNRLTMIRVILILPVVTLLYLCDNAPQGWEGQTWAFGHASAWIFVAASITDYFDGYFARKRNIVTVFGSFLDPIADKFLVVSALIMLLALHRVPALVVIVLILREMYITSLRLLAMHEELTLPVSNWGKWKTTFQMIAIPMLMINNDWLGIPLRQIGTGCIYIASLLSLGSALIYSASLIGKMKIKRAEMKKEKKNRKKNKATPSFS